MKRNIEFRLQGTVVKPEDVNQKSYGRPNTLRTTRFTPLSWLPKSIFYQLNRAANIYFLVVSVLVCFEFSPTHWSATALPFGVVILWTCFKDLFEDIVRRRDDDSENRRICWRFSLELGSFQEVLWQEVLCGDLIYTMQQEAFPADLFLLAAPESETVFLSSANLDGETNWKPRRAVGNLNHVLRSRAVESSEVSGMGTPAWAKAGRSLVRMSSSFTSRSPTVHDRPQPEVEALAQQIYDLSSEGTPLRCTAEEPCASLWEASGSLLLLESLKNPNGPGDEQGEASPTTPNNKAGQIPIGGESLLPRGCRLQGVAWCLGVAAYVGEDTKSRLNATRAIGKMTSMQQAFNRCIVGLAIALIMICLYLMFMAGFCPGGVNALLSVQYFILLYQVVPVSLYVCFEVFRMVLAKKVDQDPQFEDPVTGDGAVNRSSDVIEDMGQVSHIFSDKTGTLTENNMLLARVYLPGGHDFGEFRLDCTPASVSLPLALSCSAGSSTSNGISEGVSKARDVLWQTSGNATAPVAPAATSSASSSISTPHHPPPSAVPLLGNGKVDVAARSRSFSDRQLQLQETTMRCFRSLALCNTVTVRVDDDGAPQYAGASPEEVTFVETAGQVGLALTSRKPGRNGPDVLKLAVGDFNNEEVYEIVETLEFSSDRKRMSVILRRSGSGSPDSSADASPLLCISKGADNVMSGLLKKPLSYQDSEVLDTYASMGLRTLVLASRHLEEEFVRSWQQSYREAQKLPPGKDRDERVAALTNQVEQHLDLVGIVAIEDKLQEGVPEAVAKIRRLGAQFWMLTGDKTETAVAIAHSCRALANDVELIYATDKALEKLEEELTAEAVTSYLHDLVAGGLPERPALVLDGIFFSIVSASSECRKALYMLSFSCKVCICCRLSPQQKQLLIEMVREHSPQAVTLAIGDGANDVPMIIAAHVGIGIRGKEGMQAVQACDVAFSQFRFLVPLLVCHGRQNYRRVATFLCYFLYKHVVLVLGELIWAHLSCYAAKKAYPEQLMMVYPFISSLPIFVTLVLDQDIPDSRALAKPEIYQVGPARAYFNYWIFAAWMTTAAVHGSASWTIPYFFLADGTSDSSAGSDFWVGSLVAVYCVVISFCAQDVMIAQRSAIQHALWSSAVALLSIIVSTGFLSLTPLGRTMQPELTAAVFWKSLLSAESFMLMLAIPAGAVGFTTILTLLVRCCAKPRNSRDIARGTAAAPLVAAAAPGSEIELGPSFPPSHTSQTSFKPMAPAHTRCGAGKPATSAAAAAAAAAAANSEESSLA